MAIPSNVPVSDEFSGKRVLVTGGTEGTGKAIANRFKRGSATVIVAARSARKDQSADCVIEADLSTPEGATKVVREILDRFHGIDIVINNVGGSSAPSGGFITVTDELWQQAMNENLFPAVRLDRGFLLFPFCWPRGHPGLGFVALEELGAHYSNRLCRC